MYVFGGFTQNCTAFNDLWALDLSNRKWKRIIAKGTNPCPKGCATLLTYKDTLVLFGGRHTPITYTMVIFLSDNITIFVVKLNY